MLSKEIYRDYLIYCGTFDSDFHVIKTYIQPDKPPGEREHVVVVCLVKKSINLIKNIHINPYRFNDWFIEKRNKKINEILNGS